MNKIKRIVSVLLATLILTTITPSIPIFNTLLTVEAHSGRTDSNGGHHDYKNKSGLGSYHYHCGGYPAHLHKNGVCPYANSTTQVVPKAVTQDPDTLLREKYKSIFDDYSNKKNSGYFRLDVEQLMMQTMDADSNAADALIMSVMTPEEIADLIPIDTDAKFDIVGRIAYTRLYDAFLGQITAQEQAQTVVQQAPITNEVATQEGSSVSDDTIFKLVSQAQAALNALGFYTGEINSVFDVETQQALINFQTTFGLTVDGTINDQVVSVLGIQI